MSSFNSYPPFSGEKLPLEEDEITRFFKGVVVPSVNHLWRKKTGNRSADFLRDSLPRQTIKEGKPVNRPAGEGRIDLEAVCTEIDESPQNTRESPVLLRSVFVKIREPIPDALEGILELKSEGFANNLESFQERAENEGWQAYVNKGYAFTFLDNNVWVYTENSFELIAWNGDCVWDETEIPPADLGKPSSAENTAIQESLEDRLDATLTHRDCRDIVRVLRALGVPEVIMEPQMLAYIDA